MQQIKAWCQGTCNAIVKITKRVPMTAIWSFQCPNIHQQGIYMKWLGWTQQIPSISINLLNFAIICRSFWTCSWTLVSRLIRTLPCSFMISPQCTNEADINQLCVQVWRHGEPLPHFCDSYPSRGRPVSHQCCGGLDSIGDSDDIRDLRSPLELKVACLFRLHVDWQPTHIPNHLNSHTCHCPRDKNLDRSRFQGRSSSAKKKIK